MVLTCPYCGEDYYEDEKDYEKKFDRHVNKEHQIQLKSMKSRMQRFRDR